MKPRTSTLSDALRKIEPRPTLVSPETDAGRPRDARYGKKVISGYFDPAASRQLRELALQEGNTVQGLLAEALNALFVSRDRPPIA